MQSSSTERGSSSSGSTGDGAPRSVSGRRERVRRFTVWGAAFMAALAAAALTVTVVVARRAVSSASETIIRGEGQTLILEVEADLASLDLRGMEGVATVIDGLAEELTRVLGARASEGLRYVALVQRDGRAIARAGVARIGAGKVEDGELTIQPGIARIVTRMPPPKDPGPRPEVATDGSGPPMPPGGFDPGGPRDPRMPFDPGAAPFDPGTPFDPPMPFDPGHPPGPPTGPFLVLEFEPPTIDKLRTDANLTVVVAALAGLALVGFAVGWSRSLARVARFEQQAERERRLIALGRMSSVMAHELRNPLASLKGHAQLLAEQVADEPVSDRVKTKIDRVISEAERLELLTNSLLEFVRDRPLEVAPVAVRDVVDDALLDLPADRVRVDTGGVGLVHVDRARVARALHNLLSNAIQESPAGALVELGVARADTDLSIEVRDRGRGITSGSENHIFEPFVTTRIRGTGLGLPIARRIAEQHGGTLVGGTHPEGGAVFRMHLPGAAAPK